jgi:hypothetical protein
MKRWGSSYGIGKESKAICLENIRVVQPKLKRRHFVAQALLEACAGARITWSQVQRLFRAWRLVKGVPENQESGQWALDDWFQHL